MTYSIHSDLKSGFAYELIANGYGYKETAGAIEDEVNRLKRQINENKKNPPPEYLAGDVLNAIATLEMDITTLKIADAKTPKHWGLSRVSLDAIGGATTPNVCKGLLSRAIAQMKEALKGLNANQWGRKGAYETKLGHLTKDLEKLNKAYPPLDPHSDIAIGEITVRSVAEALKSLEVERPTLDTLAIYVLVEFSGLDKDTEFVRLYDARIMARNTLMGYGYKGDKADLFVLDLIKKLGFINFELPKGEV